MTSARAAASAGPGFWAKTAALVAKDLRVEARARETLLPMVAFAVAVTLVLAFTLPGTSRVRVPSSLAPGAVATGDVIAGFLWVTVLFAGLIGFARTFEVELAEGAVDPLLLVPVDRAALFVAKAAANLVFIALVEAVLLPLFGLLFGLDLGVRWLGVVGVAALADVGFVAAGTLFAAVAAQTRSRELILPILALPALVPVFIGATELTTQLFAGTAGALVERGWFGILVAYDVVFVAAGTVAFDYVLD